MKSLIWFFVALMTAGMLPFDFAVASDDVYKCHSQGIRSCKANSVSEYQYDQCAQQVRDICTNSSSGSSSSSRSGITGANSSTSDVPAWAWALALFTGFLFLSLFNQAGGTQTGESNVKQTPVKSNTPRRNARKRKDTPDSNDSASYRFGGRTPEFVVKRDYPADCIVCGTNTRRLSEKGKCVECINL